MDKTKSVVRSNPKPVNVFYVWYTELCRRLNCTPTPIVKPAKPKCQTVLDFVADRLKVEEWHPLVTALKQDTSLHVISIKSRLRNCQFLHDIDTEEKAKNMKRRFGSLWTAYILRQLLKSISTSLRSTEVLTCLELDGIPIFTQYLEPLLQALKKNKTVKTLSFANSNIGDSGCQMVCAYLRFIPNVEVLNISSCNFTKDSGEYIAKLIKYQQINRYCESWHNSLRYENPQSGLMRGIKRITLNCNPEFGDDGFMWILNELEDDLWIKALDLQKCGITENISGKILDTLHYNKSLEILDLRQNELLDIGTMEKVLHILRDRQQFGFEPEYQWCNTAVSLSLNSVSDFVSKTSIHSNIIHKTQSAPIKNITSKPISDQSLRKSKTVDNVQRKNGIIHDKKDNNQKVIELSNKLKSEIQKRRQIEKRNEELKQKLEKFKTPKFSENNKFLKTVVSNLKVEDKEKKNQPPKPKASTTCISRMNKNDTKALKHIKEKSIESEPKHKVHEKNGFGPAVHCNGVTNGYKNGFSSRIINSACKIFENLLRKEPFVDGGVENEDLLTYLSGDGTSTHTLVEDQETEEAEEFSVSQISLLEYMKELKNSFSVNPSKANSNSKYIIKRNHKR